jgi:putative glutamine amidotransferase
VAAVQWHPEFHVPGDPDNFDDTPLLRDFLTAARDMRAAHA